MKKTLIILPFLLLIIGFLLFPKQKEEGTELEKVVITQYGQSDVFLYLPLYIAQEEGLFRKNGLDVQITYSGNDDQIAATVVGGYADFGVGDPIFSAIIQERGGDIKTVAILVDKAPFVGYTNNPSVKDILDIHQLDGLKISSFPAPSTLYTNLTNIKNSNKSSVEIKPVSFGAQLAALEHKEVDIAMDLDPAVAIAEGNGYRTVISLAKFLPKQAITGITTKSETIKQKPETVQKVIDSLQQAVTMFYSDKNIGIRVARKVFPDVDENSIIKAVNRSYKNSIYPKTLTIENNIWQQGLKERLDAGDLQFSQETSQSTDNKFALKAAKTYDK